MGKLNLYTIAETKDEVIMVGRADNIILPKGIKKAKLKFETQEDLEVQIEVIEY